MISVDLSVLPVDKYKVQRDVDLEDIINNHTTSVPDRATAEKFNHLPLSFGVSIRSMYDNTVVGRHTDNETKDIIYTRTITEVGDFQFKGYDLIMYVSSLVVIDMCQFSSELQRVMTQHSQFQPIGLFNPDPGFTNPMIYSHVIMSDDGMKLLTEHLKPEYRVERIADIMLPGNSKALIDTLFEIEHKEEDDQ